VLAALYLRGAPRSFDVKRSAWMAVERCLRVRAPALEEAAEALRLDGLWSEAMALESDGLLSWASEVVSAGRVITAASDFYPSRLRLVLGASAPPAMWVHGAIPVVDGSDGCARALPCLAIVGSREVSRNVRAFAESVGFEAARLGLAVVSGGAKGCDRAAVRGTISFAGGFAIEVLPFGIEVWKEYAKRVSVDLSDDRVCRLSVCAPDDLFSTGSAMERNALIYAMSDAAMIVHARFKTGGTWHGAVEAHRRRLTRLIVRKDSRNAAHRALVGLGTVSLERPEELGTVLVGACDWGDGVAALGRCGVAVLSIKR